MVANRIYSVKCDENCFGHKPVSNFRNFFLFIKSFSKSVKFYGRQVFVEKYNSCLYTYMYIQYNLINFTVDIRVKRST